MRRLLLSGMSALIAVMIVFPLIEGAARAQDDEDVGARNARLGGSRGSFEQEFGKPEDEPDQDSAEYEIDDFDLVSLTFYKGKVTTITIEAPRRANWSTREGDEIAKRFLPRDAETVGNRAKTPDGDILVRFHSEDLEGGFSQQTYQDLGFTGEQGDCHFTMERDADQNVTVVTVALGHNVAEDEQPAESQASQEGEGFTLAEAAYMLTVGTQAIEMGGSLERFSELAANPRIGNTEWSTSVAIELGIWKATYAAAQELRPPPVFEDLHGVYLEAMRLYASAADDIAFALDSSDPARLQSALVKMQEATTLLVQVTEMLEAIQRERGVG